mmetsp:Transcript_33849/g.47222  ORF Transcript_33849/g.47222 Transcript_33849/m.47222 type:complete len:256 (+) Transcript_33849:123-890(+)|eukprot:CAMPEP_0185257052 /NCGR_PEP_ID=MMETSP1359-20130426/6113_1 /TAXON_ID=552665 /ORGANISM="Bigelowiella longifila, Strain CCMP242" /LENGTH=255 /DNA_ID=CAMNT_0027841939 /DNA_START=123 /DNA_END=890 /DNA_ORIENTATION=-
MGKYGNVWNYEIHLNTLSSSSVEKDVRKACKLDASLIPERDKKEETSTALQYTGSGVARIDCSKIKRPKQVSKRDREREDRKRRMGSIKLTSTAKGVSSVHGERGEPRSVVKRAIEIAGQENELKRKREIVEERRKAIQKYLTSSSSSNPQNSTTNLIRGEGEKIEILEDFNDSNVGVCSNATNSKNTKLKMQKISFTRKHQRFTKKNEDSLVRKHRKIQQMKRKNLEDFQQQNEHKKKSRRSNQEHLLSFAVDK